MTSHWNRGFFFRDTPSGMKLSLGEYSHYSAPCCVFFALVETGERPPSRFHISAGIEEYLPFQKLLMMEKYFYYPYFGWNISSFEESRQSPILNESQTFLLACRGIYGSASMWSSYPKELANIFIAHTYVIQSWQQVLLLTSKALD